MSGSSQKQAWSVVLSAEGEECFAFVHEQINSEQQLIELLASAHTSGTAVIRGKPGRVPAVRTVSSAIYADIQPMQAVLEHELSDQVIHVEAGIKITDLNRLLEEKQQWWPVIAPDHWTVADVLDSGVGGFLDHRFGGPRELVLGCKVALADGSAVKCGGRVVKNVSGYDMGKLFIGSHGWLGITFSAFLRLYALPKTSETLMWNFKSLETLFACAAALERSGLPLSCLEAAGGAVFESTSIDLPIASSGFNLITQIHGAPAVVAEIAKSCSDVVGCISGAPVSPSLVLRNAEERALWAYLSNTFSIVAEGVAAIAASFTAAEGMLSYAADKSSIAKAWLYRPSNGRLICAVNYSVLAGCAQAINDEPFLSSVSQWCALNKENAGVALVDNQHNYHAQRLPEPDLVLSRIHEDLKNRLDAQRILNPFVRV